MVDNESKRFGAIVPIPGTRHGLRWEGIASWVLYRRVKGKQGETWGDPCYPANYRHMAQLIIDGAGARAASVRELIAEMVEERERLTGVLESIIRQAAVGAKPQE